MPSDSVVFLGVALSKPEAQAATARGDVLLAEVGEEKVILGRPEPGVASEGSTSPNRAGLDVYQADPSIAWSELPRPLVAR